MLLILEKVNFQIKCCQNKIRKYVYSRLTHEKRLKFFFPEKHVSEYIIGAEES